VQITIKMMFMPVQGEKKENVCFSCLQIYDPPLLGIMRKAEHVSIPPRVEGRLGAPFPL
jgi:hypothetical protein